MACSESLKRNKKSWPTQAEAEDEARKANRRGWSLYVYRCPGTNHFHLATLKKSKPTGMTNAEWKHIRNRVADLGRQIANEDIRAAKKKVAELTPIVAEDREWLNRMKDAAEYHEACAAALRKIVDEHFRRNP